ncbi:BLOC-1-related complex subunit 8 isoform X2 [Chrysemys picta bellii]
MEETEMQLKVKKVTDKFTESMYILANEPSVALYRLQEHVRRSLPELAQHKRRCPASPESASQFLISDQTGLPLPFSSSPALDGLGVKRGRCPHALSLGTCRDESR